MADLFQRIQDREAEWNAEVVVTFLEIYNEEIRDLLTEPGSPTPRGGLQIREDKSVKVVGLVELRPNSAEEVKQIVLQGNARRTQSPTHANETSSRSHAVLQVHVTQSPRTVSLLEQRTVATLSIIDLAGSERAAATTNMGQRMVEGANINKSLLALGNCINALAESGGAVRHVPYRNSKLTRLLKFSLGGNCKTVMIVCVAPTSSHFDDTHNTLLYAERATKIRTRVVTRNVVNVDRHVGQYVEAINRLNIEVSQLKAKLAGKVAAENDVIKRRKAEALAELEVAKKDMQARMEQTQASIVEGAQCAGKIIAAQAKLRSITARLTEINAHSSTPLTSDAEAERALLQALAGPEEQALKPDSSLNARLGRSQLSHHMFQATLRAVCERRFNNLEEISIDTIQAEAKWRKAEMERIRAETEKDALKESLQSQADMLVTLLGVVGRCTVALDEASHALNTTVRGERDGTEGTVIAMATSLKAIAQRNNDAFAALLGQTTAVYAQTGTSAIDAYASQPMPFSRVPSGPNPQPIPKAPRRFSHNNIASPPRRMYKSPRKSSHSGLGHAYLRPSDKEKKFVQWKDEVGKGDLDDGGKKGSPAISIAAADSADSITRCQSVAGSESEWEDERTEDSLSNSFVAPSNHEILSASIRQNSSLRSSKRARQSHLDPVFLKTKGQSSLGCLQEADEMGSPTRRGSPLSDRSINCLSRSNDGPNATMLYIPKKGDRNLSPPRRLPTSAMRPAPSASKSARRRSNIGPVRSEKTRRRSSMIPQPLPIGEDTDELSGPRRVEIVARSPAKRPKRLSLLGNASRSLRARGTNVLSGAPTLTVPCSTDSISADSSIKTSKPTWR